MWAREAGLEYTGGQRTSDAHLLQYQEEQQAHSGEQEGSPRQVYPSSHLAKALTCTLLFCTGHAP